MIKKTVIKKMILTMAIVFSISLMYFLPGKEKNNQFKEEVTYTNNEVTQSIVYLLDNSNLLGRTKVVTNETNIQMKAKELLEILIKDGKGESKIPSGFQSIIPSDTKIISVEVEKDLIKVNFSNDLLDVKAEMEEKIIEAIVYTLTNIEGIKQVIIYVDGNVLSYLPKSKVHLPSTLDRSYGINKEYDLKSYKNVNSVVVYYVSKYNDNTYYVPVTKYLNDDRDKIKIIIDELASSPLYHSNLMSYLNNNVNLLATEQELDTMKLVFDDYVFQDANSKNILEEVIYTISLSIGDNYDVNEVVFEVGDEEICKSVIKTIENS